MMNKYEIMFIVKPDLEEASIKKEAENLKKVLVDKKAKIIEEKLEEKLEVKLEEKLEEKLDKKLDEKLEEKLEKKSFVT